MKLRHIALWLILVCLIPAGLLSGAKDGYEVYWVQPNDTWEGIALCFGVTVDSLRQMNKLGPHDQLKVGQSLAIPVSKRQPATDQLSGGASSAGNRVVGRLGVVTAREVKITGKPGAGRTLFSCAQGTQLVVTRKTDKYYGILMINGSIGWVAKKSIELQSVELVATPASGNSSAGGRLDIVREAFRYWGVPYSRGGVPPNSSDCSGLVQKVFAAHGIKLPRTAATQFQVGTAVRYDQLQPGDRLYFVGKRGNVNHTGIYIDGGQFIHASSGRGMVAVDNLGSDFYWRRFIGAKRS